MRFEVNLKYCHSYQPDYSQPLMVRDVAAGGRGECILGSDWSSEIVLTSSGICNGWSRPQLFHTYVRNRTKLADLFPLPTFCIFIIIKTMQTCFYPLLNSQHDQQVSCTRVNQFSLQETIGEYFTLGKDCIWPWQLETFEISKETNLNTKISHWFIPGKEAPYIHSNQGLGKLFTDHSL